MLTTEVDVVTGRDRLTDLSATIGGWLHDVLAGDGLVHVFAPHATAGLALVELGAGSDADLAATIDRLLPRDDRWRHRHGSGGHGADHVLPAFISPSMVLPVIDGQLALGVWQSVVLVDPNVDNPRRTVRLSFVPA